MSTSNNFAVLSLVSAILAACVSPNTFQHDDLVYGTSTNDVGATPVAVQAHGIIRSQCTQCHNSGGTFPDLTVNDQVLIGMGLVTPGDPAHSSLILKVQGLSGTIMPKVPSTPLSNTQISTLKNWVLGM